MGLRLLVSRWYARVSTITFQHQTVGVPPQAVTPGTAIESIDLKGGDDAAAYPRE
jgi:hypothetical protein